MLQRRHWRLPEIEARSGTRQRDKKTPGSGPRQWRPLRAMLGGCIGSGAAGGRPPHLAGVGAAIPAGVPSPARRAPRERWRPPNAAMECAPRYGGAIRPPRRSPGGMPRAWPDHAGAEGPPNVTPQLRRWQLL